MAGDETVTLGRIDFNVSAGCKENSTNALNMMDEGQDFNEKDLR